MTSNPVLSPERLTAARHAIRAQFFALGFASGSWGVHVPSAQAHYKLSAGELSIALLALALGAVLTLTRAGSMVQAVGPRRVVIGAGLILSASLAAVLMPEGFIPLLLVMLVFGGSTALFDVSMNAEGALLEKHCGLKVMSGFHGMWSLGGMFGAGAGALMLALHWTPKLQLVVMALATLAIVLVAQRHMLRPDSVLPPLPAGAEAEPAAADEAADGTPARKPMGVLLLLGALGISGLLAEGAIYDWSVLWMKQVLDQPQAVAALAYASFAAAMAVNRFAGDWLRSRIPPHTMLAGAALAAAAAMAATLVLKDPWVALLGFIIVGAGLANLVPIIFMAASHVPGVPPARGIAVVSGLGYCGFVAGPPLIGMVAEATSLTGGLWVVVGALLVQAVGARWLPR